LGAVLVGLAVGAAEGLAVGLAVGAAVGLAVALPEGAPLGTPLGAATAALAVPVATAGALAEGSSAGCEVAPSIMASRVSSCLEGPIGCPGGASGGSELPQPREVSAVVSRASARSDPLEDAEISLRIGGKLQRVGGSLARFRAAWCNPPVRASLALTILGLGLFSGCGSPQAKTSDDLKSDISDDEGGWSGKGQAGVVPKTTGDPSGPSVVNYPSFEVLRDGSSVVSVQIRGPVQVSEQKAEGRVIYVLNGVAVPERVNRLPMLTQHFPTQVTSVTVEQTTGAGANLVIDLREKSTSTFKLVKNEAGTMLTIVLPRSDRYAAVAKTDDPNSFERPSDAARSDVLNQSAEEGTPEDYEKESERRRRKSKRQPRPYVPRPLTLPQKTLAPDVSIALSGYDQGDPTAVLSSGIRYGIIDEFEIEATPHAFRLSPDAAFAYPSLGFTAGYTGHVFEVAGRVRYFIGIDTEVNDVSGGVLLLGAPMAIHIYDWGRIDTGAFVTLAFDTLLFNSAVNGTAAATDVRPALLNQGASPFYTDAGIPFNFLFQPAPELWFGIRHGISIYDFDAAGETLALPLGAEIGITASDDFNPIADFAVRADLPQFFLPGRDGDVVEEKRYQLAAWFRWFYHL